MLGDCCHGLVWLLCHKHCVKVILSFNVGIRYILFNAAVFGSYCWWVWVVHYSFMICLII